MSEAQNPIPPPPTLYVSTVYTILIHTGNRYHVRVVPESDYKTARGEFTVECRLSGVLTTPILTITKLKTENRKRREIVWKLEKDFQRIKPYIKGAQA